MNVSIYEVFRVNDGKPLFLSDHLARLKKSADIVGLSLWFSEEEIKKKIAELIEKEHKKNGNIKLIFSKEGEKNENQEVYELSYIPHSYPTELQYIDGVKAALLNAERQKPNAKVLNTTTRQKADKILAESDIYEVLLVNNKGFITEGSRSNVFFIKNKTVFTSPIETVLPGITRKKVFELCFKNKIEIQEKAVSVLDLENYSSAFISGTSPQILPIKSIDEHFFDVNQFILRQLMNLFKELVE